MDRSGVSRAFKDFEEKGLIVREVDEKNKRAYKITLTKKGIETSEFLIEKEKEWDDMICEELDITREDLLKFFFAVFFGRHRKKHLFGHGCRSCFVSLVLLSHFPVLRLPRL